MIGARSDGRYGVGFPCRGIFPDTEPSSTVSQTVNRNINVGPINT